METEQSNGEWSKIIFKRPRESTWRSSPTERQGESTPSKGSLASGVAFSVENVVAVHQKLNEGI